MFFPSRRFHLKHVAQLLHPPRWKGSTRWQTSSLGVCASSTFLMIEKEVSIYWSNWTSTHYLPGTRSFVCKGSIGQFSRCRGGIDWSLRPRPAILTNGSRSKVEHSGEKKTEKCCCLTLSVCMRLSKRDSSRTRANSGTDCTKTWPRSEANPYINPDGIGFPRHLHNINRIHTSPRLLFLHQCLNSSFLDLFWSKLIIIPSAGMRRK